MEARMRPHYWITDASGNAVPVPDVLTWARWMETGEGHLADDTVGDVRVSTVFLGIDHSDNGGPPVLWETMVFGGPLDDEQERYTSREDALRGHAAMGQVRP